MLRVIVCGEVHGDAVAMEHLRRRLIVMDSSKVRLFMEALPHGRFRDDDESARVASHFDYGPSNAYLELARECSARGISVYGLERPHHRTSECHRGSGVGGMVRCVLHRACTRTKTRCIESDWVDDVYKTDREQSRPYVFVQVGRLHVDPLKERLLSRRLLQHVEIDSPKEWP